MGHLLLSTSCLCIFQLFSLCAPLFHLFIRLCAFKSVFFPSHFRYTYCGVISSKATRVTPDALCSAGCFCPLNFAILIFEHDILILQTSDVKKKTYSKKL